MLMIIKPRFYLKAPIQRVPFSNEEVGLEVEREVPDDDWEKTYSIMSEQMKLMTNEYMEKLASEIEDGQSKAIEKLQIELAKTYEEKLDKASKEIFKLRDLLKQNGIQY